MTPGPRSLFYRNRWRPRLASLLLGALLIADVGFIAWSLIEPAGLERLVEESWMERLVVALPMALLVFPGLLAFFVIEGRRALDDRPLLVLDERAIFYRDWRCRPIAWRGVEGFELIEVAVDGGRFPDRSEWYLELELTDPEKYLLEAHGGGEFSEGYMRRYFRIPLRDVDGNRNAVTRALEARWQASRDRAFQLEPSLVGLGPSAV
ncbi:MAG TPA: hypothetical protein VF168_00425 [Trueperaceae bacterium]